MAARRKAETEAVVLPRCRLWHRGRTYLPGDRIALPDEDFDELFFQRVVESATAENIEAIRDAIKKRLPIPRYAAEEAHELDANAADPRDVRRRARRRAGTTRAEL
jgi:hypothetical protein